MYRAGLSGLTNVLMAAVIALAMMPSTAAEKARESALSVEVLRCGQLRELRHPRVRRLVAGDVILGDRRLVIRDVVRDVRRTVIRDLRRHRRRDVVVLRDDRADLRDSVDRLRRRLHELELRLEAEGWR